MKVSDMPDYRPVHLCSGPPALSVGAVIMRQPLSSEPEGCRYYVLVSTYEAQSAVRLVSLLDGMMLSSVSVDNRRQVTRDEAETLLSYGGISFDDWEYVCPISQWRGEDSPCQCASSEEESEEEPEEAEKSIILLASYEHLLSQQFAVIPYGHGGPVLYVRAVSIPGDVANALSEAGAHKVTGEVVLNSIPATPEQ